MNRRSFFRDALLSFAATTALAKHSLAVELSNDAMTGLVDVTSDFFVDAARGDDGWDGSSEYPWASVARACEESISGPVTIHVAPGEYRHQQLHFHASDTKIIVNGHLSFESSGDWTVV